MATFCAAIQMMFQARATAMTRLTPAARLPVHGWTGSGGEYTFGYCGGRFVIVDTTQMQSFDEVRRLLEGEAPAS